MKRDRRLTRGFGTVNLDDSAPRHAADSECQIERETARGNDFDFRFAGFVAEAHDRPLSVLLFNLQKHGVERFHFFAVYLALFAVFFVTHYKFTPVSFLRNFINFSIADRPKKARN